jgi:acyl-CoA thioesterase FadM
VANTTFFHPLTVTLYDLDLRDEVSCATLFRYFEETAIRGSAHFGFTLDWYRRQEQFWVIRTLQLERICAPRYQEELEIRTWVSSMGRVRSDRNYEIRRIKDDQLIARGIASWVYVDAAQMMPTRIHPEIVAMFEAHDPPVLPPIGKVVLDSEAPALFEHTLTRRAQFYEADSAQHTNNAVYVDWVEEGVREALCAMGYHLGLDGSSPLPWFHRHALEYVRSAVPRDEIEIRARLMHCGNTRGVWHVEILNAVSRAQILRAQTTMLWVDSLNQPIPWKQTMREGE